MKNIMLLLILVFAISFTYACSPKSNPAQALPNKTVSFNSCGNHVCDHNETLESCPADCSIPNSCNDSDEGKRIGVFGAVSGISENKEFRHSDNCTNANTVKEFYCDGPLWKSEEIPCAEKSAGNPYCKDGSVYHDATTYSCVEGACVEDQKTEPVEKCTEGCADGKCIKPAPPVVLDPSVDSCVDSDNGNNPLIKGTVTGFKDKKQYRFTDFCEESTLNEFVCQGNTYDQIKTSCPADAYGDQFCKGNNVYRPLTTYSCVLGACIPTSTQKMYQFCSKGCAAGSCTQ